MFKYGDKLRTKFDDDFEITIISGYGTHTQSTYYGNGPGRYKGYRVIDKNGFSWIEEKEVLEKNYIKV